ncbi:hypothetical protein [Risungbinella massiliensis]|uniref:hypothetical protein n=1 Tax=Risungbinella massiliensis TaxID=1329796 RepID=UPI0012B50AD8|nr:hypothetical protein [Risungbinella massiliensis]
MTLKVIKLVEDQHYRDAIRVGEYAFRYKVSEEKIADHRNAKKISSSVWDIRG